MSRGERRALIVLTTLVVLGVATRSWRSYCGAPAATPQSTAALTRQIHTVDSVRDESGRQDQSGGKADEPSSRPAGKSRGRGSRGRGQSRTQPVDDSVTAPAPVRGKLDLDSATAAQIEDVLGIGPTLAKRIVADRLAHGKFGCLAELRTVQGVGPAVMRRIDSLVTFSGLPRPTSGRCPG